MNMDNDELDPMRNVPELERLNINIDRKTDESLDATRRILQTAQQTENIGYETADKLYDQGRKLDNVGQNQERIDSAIKKNEEHLSKLERFCGVFRKKKLKKQAEIPDLKYEKIENNPNSQASGDRTIDNSGNQQYNNVNSSQQSKGQYITRITNDAREDEMEDNLQQVGSIVKNLKNIATNMGTELEKQNAQLDELNTTVNQNAERVDILDTRANKVLLGNSKPKKESNLTESIAKNAIKGAFK